MTKETKTNDDPSKEYREALGEILTRAYVQSETKEEFVETMTAFINSPKKRVIQANKMLKGELNLRGILK